MSEEAISNFTFKNNSDLTFSDVSQSWGLDQKNFSNGATYADLDNDGDLELIVNNVLVLEIDERNYKFFQHPFLIQRHL